MKVFLHGGGDTSNMRGQTFGRFSAACRAGPSTPIVLIVVAKDELEADAIADDAYRTFMGSGVPAAHLVTLFASPEQPLTAESLRARQPSGVFVCGGATPDYYAAVGNETGWLSVLGHRDIPYGGTSAGAAIAGQPAILGGWQTPPPQSPRTMIFSGAGEGLQRLTVRPGLRLAPFAVDVHAGQLGTLTRLIHVVSAGLAAEGWAIDEDTQLELENGNPRVFGAGHAYQVTADGQDVRVRIHTAENSTSNE